MEKIYILEGGDGVGKTTLANAIAEKLDCDPVVHNGPPDNGPFEKMKENYEQVAEAALRLAVGGSSTVFDRLHISNVVYGITRHPDADFLHYVAGKNGLEKMLVGLPVQRVLVRRPYHDTHNALAKQNEHWPHLFKELYLFDKLCDDKWLRIELGHDGDPFWALRKLGVTDAD